MGLLGLPGVVGPMFRGEPSAESAGPLGLLGGGPTDCTWNRPLNLLGLLGGGQADFAAQLCAGPAGAAWGGLADFPTNRPLSLLGPLGLLGLLGAFGPTFQQIVR